MENKPTRKWMKQVLAFSVMVAIILPLTLTAQDLDFPTNLHPLVAKIAADSPEEIVRLIVQKTDASNDALTLVESLDAEVLRDLALLNAFVVELSASDAVRLARSPMVARVSLDGAISASEVSTNDDPSTTNTYLWSTNTDLAREKLNLDGDDIGVAVIDSGVDAGHPCLDVQAAPFGSGDDFGHGTHVAGIIACDTGNFVGMAPDVDLISLKVFDAEGKAFESDVVAALEWVYNNRVAYNIRVVNMSFNSTYESSYHESYMNAAAELLWFNGVVVVVSAGNKGPLGGHNTVNTAPANDPFLIAVGASDEHDTYLRDNDTYAPFSSAGITDLGHSKPDVVAPGYNIISSFSSTSDWDADYPTKMVGTQYIRLSGTSMSAPVVSGAVALLLEWKPDLTPDQVKYLLQNTGSVIYKDNDGYPYLDFFHLVMNAYYWENFPAANTGELVSQLLFTGDQEAWDSVAWNSVAWNSVAWNSVAWNSVAWNSVAWNSVAWNSVAWNSVAWNSVELNAGIYWGKTRNANAELFDEVDRAIPTYEDLDNNSLMIEDPSKIKGPKK